MSWCPKAKPFMPDSASTHASGGSRLCDGGLPERGRCGRPGEGDAKNIGGEPEKRVSCRSGGGRQEGGRTKAELKKNSVLGLAMTWSDALTLEGKGVARGDGAGHREGIRGGREPGGKEVPRPGACPSWRSSPPNPPASPCPAKPRGPRVESFTPANVKPVKLPEWAEKALNASKYRSRPLTLWSPYCPTASSSSCSPSQSATR